LEGGKRKISSKRIPVSFLMQQWLFLTRSFKRTSSFLQTTKKRKVSFKNTIQRLRQAVQWSRLQETPVTKKRLQDLGPIKMLLQD